MTNGITLLDKFVTAADNFFEVLYDIEHGRVIDHSQFIHEIESFFGCEISDAYSDWYEENE